MHTPRLLLSVVLFVFAFGLRLAAEAPPVRLLTIGNSFAHDATHYLPSMAESAGRRLVIFHANIGGASLERQMKQVTLAETAPDSSEARAYTNRADPRTGDRRDFNLAEALEATAWDFVTIQQASPLSHRAETYEPHATSLIAFIRKHAPSAEILVHQTWAYRQDYPGYAKENFSMEKMHAALVEAYDQLAKRHALRLMPVGEAFNAARQTPRWTFTAYPDPHFDYKNPPAGAVPAQPGSINAGWRWTRNPKTGKDHLWHDYLHANDDGRYLAAAVWFEVLFAQSAETITYVPPTVTAEDARALRAIAHAAIEARSAASLTP
jgi:lysophospholipase L1-like esterase